MATPRSLRIRAEEARDRAAVRRVHTEAFGRPDEADLVDRLREQARPYLGLVAEQEGAVVGHIAFSPVTVAPPSERSLWGLAPMAVRPALQRQGIGTALVEEGLRACRRAGGEAVVVLGHPRYYPRFGFRPASRFGLSCVYDAPDEAFLALELTPGGLDGVAGVAHYHPTFAG
ncbi:MAG: N-acetyltransferase [Rubricoccaceae bacterium]|nr:N-acetyltransferase [Rubricoccaceae bacterium]